MNPTELALLLTTARILRARISRETYAECHDDWGAMNEALKPFDPSPNHGGDFERREYNGGDTPPI